jgi:hypothetical protein
MRSDVANRQLRSFARHVVFALNEYVAAHPALDTVVRRALRLFPRANERVLLVVLSEREIRSQDARARAELLTVDDLSPRALQVYLHLVAATNSRNEAR